MDYLVNMDKSLLSFFSEDMKNSFFDVIMPWISRINNHGEVWIVLAIILMINKDIKIRRLGISVLVALALGEILGNQLIKNFIGRTRPIGDEYNFKFIINLPKSYSFPSGHTGSSFAVFGAFIFSKAKYKYWVLAMAVLIAFSRMYLHVHFPSDILGGILLGLLCGKIAVIIGNAFFRNR
jgi:undecaprenyl-diphosphatase